ncbi:hypothetical protein NDU88_004810, partial [Pleurodeles waltl]
CNMNENFHICHNRNFQGHGKRHGGEDHAVFLHFIFPAAITLPTYCNRNHLSHEHQGRKQPKVPLVVVTIVIHCPFYLATLSSRNSQHFIL